MIAPGDPLFGSTVAEVQFGGLNDAGEIAFVASLTDGTKGIFRADPIGVGLGDDMLSQNSWLMGASPLPTSPDP